MSFVLICGGIGLSNAMRRAEVKCCAMGRAELRCCAIGQAELRCCAMERAELRWARRVIREVTRVLTRSKVITVIQVHIRII